MADYTKKLRDDIALLKEQKNLLEASAEHTKRYGFEVSKGKTRLEEFNKKLEEIKKLQDKIYGIEVDKASLGKEINNITKKYGGNLLKTLKIEGSLNDPSANDNKILREVAEGSTMPQKTSTAEDTVAYIKENYPETEENLQRVLNDMYLTFCRKQFDYGPGNIAMGTSLKNEEEVNIALLGIIVRLNDKINRLVNLSTKHNFEAQNEPIEDAFLDTAIYAAMALIVKNQKWGK